VELECEVVEETLTPADYVVSEDCAVERKELHDFSVQFSTADFLSRLKGWRRPMRTHACWWKETPSER